MRDRQRKEEIEKSRRDENKVVFTSAPRQDPNRGMRFVNCSDPINKGKLGSSRSFIKKIDRKYYQKQRRYMKLTETTVKTITSKYSDI